MQIPSSKLIRKVVLRSWAKLNLTGLPDTVYCSAALHSQCQSVLGQVKWLQSRTQHRACYRFSRCASASAGPTIVDARAFNKLARSIRAKPCALRYWPLKGLLRLVGYPDAAYRDNVDTSSQRGQAMFLPKRGHSSRMVFALWWISSRTQLIE